LEAKIFSPKQTKRKKNQFPALSPKTASRRTNQKNFKKEFLDRERNKQYPKVLNCREKKFRNEKIPEKN
jgi:hypothetical protein